MTTSHENRQYEFPVTSSTVLLYWQTWLELGVFGPSLHVHVTERSSVIMGSKSIKKKVRENVTVYKTSVATWQVNRLILRPIADLNIQARNFAPSALCKN